MATARDDQLARRRSAALAGHQHDAATARTLLSDTEPAVRATALGALARAEGLTPDDLAVAITDPAPVVRRRAAEEVAALADDPEGRARGVSLLPLLEDPDDSVAEVAAWACGERRPPEPEAARLLASLAEHHPDPLVREAAVAALGAIGDPAGLPAILTATADKPAVRRRAVLALAPFDGPEVDAALEHARTDRDWQVRQAAEDLLEG
jgi:HEAT repeat protein